MNDDTFDSGNDCWNNFTEEDGKRRQAELRKAVEESLKHPSPYVAVYNSEQHMRVIKRYIEGLGPEWIAQGLVTMLRAYKTPEHMIERYTRQRIANQLAREVQ